MTQQEALDILKLGHNVYLTGQAGSGKTYVLNKYIEYLKKNEVEVAITASTGIAATHMGGVTIHSWSGIGVRDAITDYDLEAMEEKRYLWDKIKNTKVLIIDEVSMLHHFRLDMVEKVVRAFKRNSEPFGGIQVILCGDFFQLPPVSRMGEEKPEFIYRSESWRDLNLKVCYLHEQFRQTDDKMLSVLNAIRTGVVSTEARGYLAERHAKATDKGNASTLSIEPTRLYTHNIDVDQVNVTELSKIPGEARLYVMSSRGTPFLVETLKKSCLAPERLQLKK